jgi:hypothetical protein
MLAASEYVYSGVEFVEGDGADRSMTVTPPCDTAYMSSIGFGTCEGDDGSVLDAIVKLLVADPAQCGRDGLALLVQRSLRVRGWLDAIDGSIAAQAARLAASGQSTDPATLLGAGGRRSRRDAEAAAARGTVCDRMPALGQALADGAISAGHVDAVVAAARTLDDDGQAQLAGHAGALVKAATESTPEQFAGECKELAHNLCGDGGLSRHERLRRERNVRRWVDRHTGMCNTLLSLDPLTDAAAWTAINAAVAAARAQNQRDDDRTWDQLQADVVVDLLTGVRSDSDARTERVPEVSVLVDLDTLVGGLHGTSVCETSDGVSLPVESLRRLCCEADVLPIVLGGSGEALDVGRSCRVANRAQRRALRAMYRTCAHPQCTVGFEACRIHHIIFWFHGGNSDLDNLVPLCEMHHHLVHEGGWTLQLHPERRTTWTTPGGTIYHDGITTDRRPTAAAGDPPEPTAPCKRHGRQSVPTTAAEVANQLLDALDQLRGSTDATPEVVTATAAATTGDDRGRGPPP